MKRLLPCVLLFVCPLFAEAKPDKPVAPESIEPKEFFRVKKNDDGKVSALEVAITRYESKDGKIKVDLVGVVHIGDASYYSTLNRRLGKYETVLYELVAAEGTRPIKGQKKDDSLLSMLPKIMSFVLDLDSQMNGIDYSRKNFVHADMSFDEMLAVAAERGDDKLTLGLSVLVDTLRKQNLDQKKGKKNAKDPLANLSFTEVIENPNLLKQIMAEQMVGNQDMGPTIKKLLVEDRNKKTCQVLTRELLAGKKHFAIFYGAAHNADFDKKLRGEYQLRCVGQEWLSAWDGLDGPPTPPELRLLKILLTK